MKEIFKNMKARLLFTSDCFRNCKGCCNKNWTGIPVKKITFDELLKFDEINITGGEPMMYVEKLKELISRLKKHDKKVYLYTSLPYPYQDFIDILKSIDGCSLTLHTVQDYKNFTAFDLNKINFPKKSLRLNVFPKIKITSEVWEVRPKVWIKDCPLPEDEIFVEL